LLEHLLLKLVNLFFFGIEVCVRFLHFFLARVQIRTLKFCLCRLSARGVFFSSLLERRYHLVELLLLHLCLALFFLQLLCQELDFLLGNSMLFGLLMAANVHSDCFVGHLVSLGQHHLYCILARIILPLVAHYIRRRQFRSCCSLHEGWLRQTFLFRERARAFMLRFVQHLVIWYQVRVLLTSQLGRVLRIVQVDYAMILSDLLLNHWGSFGESLRRIHRLVLLRRWKKLLVGNRWRLHMLDRCQWPCLEVIDFLTLIVNRAIFLDHELLLLGGGSHCGSAFLSVCVLIIFICVQDSL